MVTISDCLNLKRDDVLISVQTRASLKLTTVKTMIGTRSGVVGVWLDGADWGQEYRADYDTLRFFDKETKGE